MQDKIVFSEYIRTDEVLFKHAKGMRDVVGLELHPFHEIFLFMGGDAEFISNTFRAELIPQTLVLIPKETFHHFIVYSDEKDYHRFVLNFNDIKELEPLISEKINKVCLFPATDEICRLFEKLGSFTSENDEFKKRLLLKAVFTEILLEIEPMSNKDEKFSHLSVNPIIRDAVKYIGKNAHTIEHVEDVAKAVNLSASYLSHLFRKELCISPHRYILEQKLILANRKIESGMGAVQASAECGFANYSGFYKMYKKMFGYPPSKAQQKQI